MDAKHPRTKYFSNFSLLIFNQHGEIPRGISNKDVTIKEKIYVLGECLNKTVSIIQNKNIKISTISRDLNFPPINNITFRIQIVTNGMFIINPQIENPIL